MTGVFHWLGRQDHVAVRDADSYSLSSCEHWGRGWQREQPFFLSVVWSDDERKAAFANMHPWNL